MTVSEILADVRENLDDLDPLNSLWSNDALIRHLNKCISEIAILVPDTIIDSSSPMTNIVTTPYTSQYVTDSRIIVIVGLNFTSIDTLNGGNIVTNRPLSKTNIQQMDAYEWEWQTKTGTPERFFIDGGHNLLTIYPTPVNNGFLSLRIQRFPLGNVTSNNMGVEPEINTNFHPWLASGVCKLATRKQGSQTFDAQAYERYSKEWDLYMGEIRKMMKDNEEKDWTVPVPFENT